DDGANRLFGDAGDDALIGGGGDDALAGGTGDDVLDGGLGADTLAGGDGVDLAAYAGSAAGVTVDLAAGTGTGGTAEGDTLAGIEDVAGSAHDDILAGDAESNRLDGGAGDDGLDGRDGDDVLVGGLGDDTLAGRADDDQLLGGAGDDVLAGGAGADRLDGGAGRDRASYAGAASGVAVSLETGIGTAGEAAGDVLAGIEDLTGSAHADTLAGDAGGNGIAGGAGADTILGGGGDDALAGGAGSDTLWGEAGDDALDGGDGTDTVRYGGSFYGYELEKGATGAAAVTDAAPGVNGDDGTDTLANVERIVFADRTIFLDGTNNRPDARADATATKEDVGLVIRAADLLANDFDVDRDGLTLTGVSGAANGTVRLLANGNVEFVPDANFAGAARFTYTVSDGEGGTHSASVTVDVTPVNDAPRITSYSSGSKYSGTAASLEITDPDGSSNGVTITVVGGYGARFGDVENGRCSVRESGDFGVQIKVTDADGGARYYTIFGHTESNGLGGGGKGGGNGGQEKFGTYIDAVFLGLVDVPSEPEPDNGNDRPIVLDLDGDGVELVGLSETAVRFDMDGDGARDLTGWAGADDGILAFDHDGDGRVTDRSEIVIADYGRDGMTDLEALAHAFDGNRDGVFDAGDAEWHRFGVWRDADQDGVTDDGEFATLDALGIAAIGLDRTGETREVDGNTIFGEAVYTRTDGTTGAVGDVAFGYRRGTATGPELAPAEADPAGDAALDRLIQAMAMFGADGDSSQDAAPVPMIDPAMGDPFDDDPAQQAA
ncbi:MAG TPA: cadherin-like domain-containing protein, partial [Alphaproteobacteria bacterium]|nr:cadherin-like domain-containing protein [Alphaproteobacteria bacterium]